jgi:hypothetical protein
MYEWYLSILDDGDQEVIRFLRKTGEDHMANMPTSRGGSTSSRFGDDIDYSVMNASLWRSNPSGIAVTKSKWERIGKPLFSPSIEMVMYFTPMNPVIYRMIRGGLTAYDIEQGVYDYD